MKRDLFITLSLIASLLLTENATACSCASVNLEQRYALSSNVFTAVIVGVEFVECTGPYARVSNCTNFEAKFEVTRKFKGDVPFDNVSSGSIYL